MSSTIIEAAAIAPAACGSPRPIATVLINPARLELTMRPPVAAALAEVRS